MLVVKIQYMRKLNLGTGASAKEISNRKISSPGLVVLVYSNNTISPVSLAQTDLFTLYFTPVGNTRSVAQQILTWCSLATTVPRGLG